MISRSTWLHLRIPFSFFLLPIFIFAVSVSPHPSIWKTLLVFFILHFLLYPASNGYNSYYDKDEDSIGGLEKPPPVSKELWYVSLILDGIALLAGIFLGWIFVTGLFVYGLISKLYSYDKVRLKKYPILSWILASFFQGAFTFLMTYQAINALSLEALTDSAVIIPALLSTAFLGGSYPMTQVYQHAEDARRGDMTLSRLLGIRGTFIFAAVAFQLTSLGFWYYFQTYYEGMYFVWFILCLAPGLVHFLVWTVKVWKDKKFADFRSTMRLNWLTATGMNLFFIIIGILIHIKS
ncbi:UbiA family prenyltransferase [Cytophagaceae bacterium DM2B3-1]|uniref:UbiA family prenyltransferase n=1 Tax=Xanthocytophaga flava TaxID=3048013 RepID=A0ABT7CN97_9BACT|nr:UbiA family prenyltransferase [Xanthocytophaga flavus]MDJ1495225.1 UbiA family prenyltransferase [Xanthocytophaga flavus]